MKLLKFSFIILKYVARISIVLALVSLIFYTENTNINDMIVKYTHLGFNWFKEHYLMVIVLTITPFFIRKTYHHYVITAKELRSERLHTEIDRHLTTPYISPLHLLYMMKPPRWIKDDHEYVFRDFLYKEATTAFSQIIYVNFKYESYEPIKKPASVLNIISKQTYKKIFISLGSILLFGASYYVFPYFFPNTINYAILTLPLIFRHIFILVYIIKAIIQYGTFNQIKKMLLKEFNTLDPNVKWIELFPNTTEGQAILTTWKQESALRQFRDTEHRNPNNSADLSIPNKYDPNLRIHFELNDISVCPYPNMKIPSWYEDYINYINKKQKENHEENYNYIKNITNGKVISIHEIRNRKYKKA